MNTYNSWPLGKLPVEMQRTEPARLKELGYEWDDPRDIVEMFEEKLAKYAGSKFAVVVDCDSNALFLSLKYRQAHGTVMIPVHTYVSVPMQIIHAGLEPIFQRKAWTGCYELSPWNIHDSAARFTKDMYVGNDALQILSFQIKKRLPIGKGGAILTDSPDAYKWLKLSSYDGRDLKTPYDSQSHVMQLGWHYYMTPEDAARGIILMDILPPESEDSMSWSNYPDLSTMEIFKDIQVVE